MNDVENHIPDNRFARAKIEKMNSHIVSALMGALAGVIVTYLVLQPNEDTTTKNSALSQAEAAVTATQSTSPAVENQKNAPATLPAAPTAVAKLITESSETPATKAAPKLDASAPEPPERVTREVEIKRGDTLMDVLVKAGANRQDAHAAITALTKVFDPRRLRPGHKLDLVFEKRTADGGKDDKGITRETARLVDLSFDESVERRVLASLGPDGFQSFEIKHPLTTRLRRADIVIEDSLYLAAERADLPPGVIIDLIHLYSFDVDFQRDIQPGNRFEVFYETFHTATGAFAYSGEIMFAALHTGGTILPLYRFEMSDGEIDYFNEKGESVRKALMKTPIDGARLSSRFGRRRHPILGYTKMHKGIDFAAPKGTPIMAAGSGTLKFVGRKGGYGKYVRIRHNSEYSTAYAHMSGFRRGIKSGKRVKQGQIIGYVGSTGRSTGPHLHYEILRQGRQINPLGLKLPTGKKLKGKEIARFKNVRDQIVNDYAATPAPSVTAEGSAAPPSD